MRLEKTIAWGWQVGIEKRGCDALAEALEGLESPSNFFRGCASEMLPVARNVLVFLRVRFGELQRRLREASPHPRYVLIFNLKTAGAVNVDGRVYQLKPGEAFLVFPYQMHHYLDLESDELRWAFLTFESSSGDALVSLKNRCLKVSEERRAAFYSIVKRFGDWQRGVEMQENRLLLEVAGLLEGLRIDREMEGESGPTRMVDVEKPGLQLMLEVNRFLNEVEAEAVSVESIAARVGMSERGLRNRFRRETGYRIGDYIHYFKMNKAMGLLADTRFSLTEVALECGFGSLSAFSRSFKNEVGISPKQFRVQSRG